MLLNAIIYREFAIYFLELHIYAVGYRYSKTLYGKHHIVVHTGGNGHEYETVDERHKRIFNAGSCSRKLRRLRKRRRRQR